ncbi:UDP-2,3-diacylglucosamine diphosphatase [Idiomarina seosinensis]|uniref:UDP-2,3-diacylglucosamine hydrolase n=1 Tax=Idiomarina seosinensis TaxID=281739 RepID=A0A432ZGK9_9GAMM|nr:UDP-2,3-diacylglucosamine diphosphatase [Idiomarina seosinensis]RUO77137.1 UDP-2,3-diacylglucosamine diphosphatase [Idiomarina seosinensis]
MSTAFIADLHLSPAWPDITAAFRQFCQSHTHLKALYILGDLFDAWLGDDDPSEFATEIKDILKEISQQGVALYFIPGNRDFMLGQRFAKEVGLTLLPDETVIDLNGDSVLLMHGDTLCTEDKDYLRYRAIIQHPVTLFILRHLPLSLRMRIARKLRAGSASKRPNLSQARLRQMDAQHPAVIDVMKRHQVQQLIHGHTHRAAVHTFCVNGKKAERIVLGDWYDAQKVLNSKVYSGIYKK